MLRYCADGCRSYCVHRSPFTDTTLSTLHLLRRRTENTLREAVYRFCFEPPVFAVSTLPRPLLPEGLSLLKSIAEDKAVGAEGAYRMVDRRP